MNDLAELERKLHNLFREGEIASVQGKLCRVKSGDITTTWLPWFTLRAGTDRTWWAPNEGEQCMVFSPSGELSGGRVLVGLYSDDHDAPSEDPNVALIEFRDGTVISYDTANNHLDVTAVGTVTITADGDVTVQTTANIHATADQMIKATAANIQAVAAQSATVQAATVNISATTINLTGVVNVNGPLNLAGPLNAAPGATGGGATLQGELNVTGNTTLNGNVATVGSLTNNGSPVGSTHKHISGAPGSMGGTPQ